MMNEIEAVCGRRENVMRVRRIPIDTRASFKAHCLDEEAQAMRNSSCNWRLHHLFTELSNESTEQRLRGAIKSHSELMLD